MPVEGTQAGKRMGGSTKLQAVEILYLGAGLLVCAYSDCEG